MMVISLQLQTRKHYKKNKKAKVEDPSLVLAFLS